MRKAALAFACFVSFCMPLLSQENATLLEVRVVLVDQDLNQKVVPHLSLVLAEDGALSNSREFKTDLEGKAQIRVPTGKYILTTPQGIDFQGHHYSWEIRVSLNGSQAPLELSNDNARTTNSSAVSVRKVDDLTQLFQKYQNSVVTVWSEVGSGTGFIIDPAGLVITNQHVIGPSELISVQFDADRKVEARILAFDAERDIAVLYANLSAFPGAIAAPLPDLRAGGELAVEGERVFTIGSPLKLKKVITGGIVSKVETRAIISDVNINHGNSGGPLFNSLGEVIGITTFLLPTPNGPSISGIVRIDQALPTLEQARKKMKDVPLPSARLMPVEPTDPYPLDSLKEKIRAAKFDRRPYVFTAGGFDVALATPVLKYESEQQVGLAAAKEKGKRTRQKSESVQNSFEPLQDMREWEEYVGEYRAVLHIEASPQLRETFMSALGRGLANSQGMYGGPARMKFKTDFYRMKLFCGDKEIEPIQPGKAADVVNAHNAFVNVTDATYVGIYSYPADAVSPSCGKVRLELYSEKQPDKPEVKELDERTINQIWGDFQPYRDTHKQAPSSQ